MVLSKRERYIAIATVATLSLVVLYYGLIDGWIQERNDLGDKIQGAQTAINAGNLSKTRVLSINPIWQAHLKSTLKSDASTTETQLFDSVVEWGRQSGVNLSINKQDRIDKDKDFSKITLRATGKCNMATLRRLLFKIETAEIPVRVSDITVSSNKDGLDDLQVQFTVGSIFFTPEPEKKPNALTLAVKE